jgi:hypothetical protein
MKSTKSRVDGSKGSFLRLPYETYKNLLTVGLFLDSSAASQIVVKNSNVIVMVLACIGVRKVE